MDLKAETEMDSRHESAQGRTKRDLALCLISLLEILHLKLSI